METFTNAEDQTTADPDFHSLSPNDMLLGAYIYSVIIQDGVLKYDNNRFVTQRAKLRWVLSGNVRRTMNCFVALNEVDDLSRFWETEEINEDIRRLLWEVLC